MVLATERLVLREMGPSDFPALCQILRDEEVMYAYEGALNEAEAREWLDKQMRNYKTYGFGLWAAVLKESGEMIGQCGLTMQNYCDTQVLEVGYLFQKACWHKGYAAEAAIACREYAFKTLHADEVFSIIRDTNIPSQNVARRNGMIVRDQIMKHYRGVDMPHLVFSVRRGEMHPLGALGV